MLTQQEKDLAFNAGSDARIDGLQLNANPYDPSSAIGWHWRRGWLDCHLRWAEDAVWQCRELPDVTMAAA